MWRLAPACPHLKHARIGGTSGAALGNHSALSQTSACLRYYTEDGDGLRRDRPLPRFPTSTTVVVRRSASKRGGAAPPLSATTAIKSTPFAIAAASRRISTPNAQTKPPPNPWDYVLSLVSQTDVTSGLSHTQLMILVSKVKAIYRTNSVPTGTSIPEWWPFKRKASTDVSATPDPPPDPPIPMDSGNTTTTKPRRYFHALPAQTRDERELILTHISALRVKAESERGHHWEITSIGTGRQTHTGWSKHNVKAISEALCAMALNQQCPAFLMNVLLECPVPKHLSTRFYRKACESFFASAEDVRGVLDSSKRLHDLITSASESENRGGEEGPLKPGIPSNTGFLRLLWSADSLGESKATLFSLVETGTRQHAEDDCQHHPQSGSESRRHAATNTTDALITVLAAQLMDIAFLFGDRRLGHDVFWHCHPWLAKSLVSYSTMLKLETKELNMPAIVLILKTMRQHGVLPDQLVWTDIMVGMCINGQYGRAKKLFSLHLLFLPHEPAAADAAPKKQQHDGSADDDTTTTAGQRSQDVLYAPASPMSASGGPEAPNIWAEWFHDPDRDSELDPFIWSWMQELAERYRMEGPDSPVTPWLPNITTHRVLLTFLCRAGFTAHVLRYYNLLKAVWPHQYSRWMKSSDRRYPDNDPTRRLNSITRIVHGHLVQFHDNVRDSYGLGLPPPPQSSEESQDADATTPASSAGGGGPNKGSEYYHYCDEILELAALRPPLLPSPSPSSSPSLPGTNRRADPGDALDTSDADGARLVPSQMVFSKTIRAYSKRGDIHTILYHMRRAPLQTDIASWTSLIQCICEQVVEGSPFDARMVYPRSTAAFPIRITGLGDSAGAESAHPRNNNNSSSNKGEDDWLGFVFEIAFVLKSKGMEFTHRTFGALIHATVEMEDFGQTTRVVDFMQEHSYVRVTPWMVKMMVRSAGLPFPLKWELVRSMVGIDALKETLALHKGGDGQRAAPPPSSSRRYSTVHPNRKLLSFIIRMAAVPADFALLREIVADFDACFGVRPMFSDCVWVLKQCRILMRQDDHHYWMDRLQDAQMEAAVIGGGPSFQSQQDYT
ncbi:hypothetical protein H4217_005388 [Coemansia sp. RSA 1939]|nr:hypothetical protein H4217_005388 [Coemansia sp. RSA 1939]